MFAIPGAGISAVVIVTCNSVLLVTSVLTSIPFTTTTEEETNALPFTVRG
jgi:predicted aconitase with swiveling domain